MRAAPDTLRRDPRVDSDRIAAIGFCFGGGAPLSQVMDLNKEMKEAGVDYQIVLYGHAVHAFTEPKAGSDPAKGAAYEPKADRRSWEAMQDFLSEVFMGR